jgi:DNA-binding CsgD family transcriptional regulator
MDALDEIIDVKNPEFFQRYSFYIPKLPETEKILLGYVEKGLNQNEIAQNLKVTQGAISSRISRIKKRLKFLIKQHKYHWESIDTDLKWVFPPFELELIKGMINTTCQTETARQLNAMFNLQGEQQMTQVKIKHRFNLCIERLKQVEMNRSLRTNYVRLFNLVRNNLYCLHEVKLPHFDHQRNL